MADTTQFLVKIALPYLFIEYLIMFAFNNKMQNVSGNYSSVFNTLLGIFAGVGAWMQKSMPPLIAYILILIHVIMLSVFGLWLYQSINPV